MNDFQEQDTASGRTANGSVTLSKNDAQGATQKMAQPPQSGHADDGRATEASATSAVDDTAKGGATKSDTVKSDTAKGALDSADKVARNWAVAAHLSGLSLYLGIPFGNILGPLVVWLIKKDESPFAEQQAKEALNFQISLTIYGVAAALLAFVFIGFLLIPVLFILQIVLTVVATLKASEGEAYEYPLTIRLIS